MLTRIVLYLLGWRMWRGRDSVRTDYLALVRIGYPWKWFNGGHPEYAHITLLSPSSSFPWPGLGIHNIEDKKARN